MAPHNSFSQGNNIQLYIRSAIFFAGQVISTLVIAPLMIIAVPFLSFDFRYRYLSGVWVRFNLWALKKICGLGFQIDGLENIPDHNAIIFCKHQSAWETIALQTIFAPIVFIMKRELLFLPFFGWALATCNPIAIDRQSQKKALQQVIGQGIQRLKNGSWVVIFPEGTRVAPGESKKYSGGGALLAQKSGYQVLPIAHNAGDFWPRKSFLKRPGVIRVQIGPAIESKGKSAKGINVEAAKWIENQMRKIGNKSNS